MNSPKEEEGGQDYKKRHLFIGRIISYPTMAAEIVSGSNEFDIFATRPVQNSTLETTETAYKSIASLEQSDMEFLIPSNHDTYIDLNIQPYFRRKLTKTDGTNLEATGNTSVVNNLLYSLYEQCNISLNGITITHAAELYIIAILTYGRDAASSHLTKAFWYRDTGDIGACEDSSSITPGTNMGCSSRCNRIKLSKLKGMVGRLHTVICNVPTHLLPGVRMQI